MASLPNVPKAWAAYFGRRRHVHFVSSAAQPAGSKKAKLPELAVLEPERNVMCQLQLKDDERRVLHA